MRNLKMLGIALIAAFAMSAIAASAASAVEFHSLSAPVTLTGSQDVQNKFLTTTGTVTCTTATISATQSAKTVASITTAIPKYEGCTCFGFSCTIDMNKCVYVLYATGTADISCPNAGEEITLTASQAGTSKCVVHVPPQKNLEKVKYTNITPADTTTREVTIDLEIEKIHYTHTEGTGLGKCTPGTGTTGSLTGSVLVTGENAGVHVGIFVE